MHSGIQELRVGYVDRARKQIRSVRLSFGSGYWLELTAGEGWTRLVLASREQVVSLDVAKPLGDFQRALNLIRLHIPAAARARPTGDA